MQTVGFDDNEPVAEALLVYGQSVDPESPHAFDQMKEFSAKRWIRRKSEPSFAESAALTRAGRIDSNAASARA